MPTATREFTVALPQKELWTLINTPNELGKCIPGCEEVTILNSEESKWTMKISVGVISRRIEAKARIVEREEPSRLVVQLESVDGDLTAKLQVQLTGESSNSTRVNFSADIEARGPFQWIVNQVIKGQLDKLTNQFVQSISSRAKA